MLKKHILLMLISCLLLSCFLYYTVVMGYDTKLDLKSWYLLGKEKAEIDSVNGNPDQVVAKVNDTEILKSKLDHAVKMEKLKYEYQQQKYEKAKQILGESISETNIVPPQEVDPDQILDRLIENEVLYQEAKAQGLDVSYEEAANYANEIRRIQQQIVSGEITVPNPEEYFLIQEMITQYIKGMGVTEDDYWAMTVPIYQKTLSIGKLKAKVISSMQKEDGEDANAFFEQYVKDLKKTLQNTNNEQFTGMINRMR